MRETSTTEKWKEEWFSRKQAFENAQRKDFEAKLTNELRTKIEDETRKELPTDLGKGRQQHSNLTCSFAHSST